MPGYEAPLMIAWVKIRRCGGDFPPADAAVSHCRVHLQDEGHDAALRLPP